MAKLVLGLGSSHGPQLALPPEHWWMRRDWDRKYPELWYQGRVVTFDELVDERAGEHLEHETTQDTYVNRFNACQQAIGTLSETLEQAAPDVAIILGDDQHECFLEDNMPSISVFWGDSVDAVPLSPDNGSGEFSLAPPELSRFPKVRTAYPGAPDLGRHLIGHLVEHGFDPAHTRQLPAGHRGEHNIGHAFSYVYRRLMHDEVLPHVPVFLNTYYPPNQPTLGRSYALGKALRGAIEAWDSDARVAIIASGGLSHFVIEEALDRQIIDALQHKDEATLTGLPVAWFNSGNSEIRNWIALAGAMEDTGWDMELIDYVPCYRSEAGTGCAMAFATWQ
ncbi:MAG: 3-O-methylgallate 3,4-dioxygenase [Chloroflexota bacterium]|jgi:3-O-methylgallate 3,4-dioxygenase|nr:3-O-methylgallate 3,4-dioxygenase [Chloroflexota bacterium]